MKITQDKVYKLASNTKTLRILNHHFKDDFKDDFKALWGKKYNVVCDYTQRIRIYFGLVEAHDDIEMPLFIDGKSKKDNTLFKRVNQDNLDEAKQHLNKIEQQNRKKTAKEFRNYRPTIAELAKAFKAEERAENKKYNL